MPVIFNKEKQYLPIVQATAQKYSIPAALIMAHIRQESNFDPKARLDEYTAAGKNWDSSYGMVQLLLGTAKGLDPNATAEKLMDPAYNIDLAGKLIAQNISKNNGDMYAAVASYNAGTARKNAQGKFVNSKGDTKVQTYVDRVMGFYFDYSKWIDNGANMIDVSVNPWLVAGFVAVVILSIAGIAGGIYAGKNRK